MADDMVTDKCMWCQLSYKWSAFKKNHMFLYPRPTKLEGGYTGFTLSVCPSVRLSVDDMVSGA